MKETKKAYDHNSRLCEYPDCGKNARRQGHHSDGTVYRRPWCKVHLRGSKKGERIAYANSIKKYQQKQKKI